MMRKKLKKKLMPLAVISTIAFGSLSGNGSIADAR